MTKTSEQVLSEKKPRRRYHIGETIIHAIFLILGLVAVGCVLIISIYLILSGIPAIKEIGLVETMADVAKYYYHGVSHYLGAETHDIGRYTERVLQPGMVLTVEPGLYIEEWGIGIRIEDDALVTEDGCEIMTKDMIKTVEEIEAFMAKGKQA